MIEFTKVVEVIDVVAVPGFRRRFASGRNPDIVHAGRLELIELIVEPLPMFVVVRDIPFKPLKHGHVFRGRFLL